MDFLDSNLHQSILGALASNLASSSTQDDLSLLTDSFSALEPVTNGLVNGVLSRLGGPASQSVSDTITIQQANSIIAFSQYASKAAPSPGNHERLLQLLRCAPTWDVEASLGLQSAQDWSPPDQLSHALVSGLLALTSAGAGDRTSALRAIADYQKALVDEIERAEEGHRIIGYLLPALNGARRALNESLFTWTVSDTPPVTASSSSDHLRTVQGALEQSWDLNTEGGRLASATLQQYETTGSPISAGLLVLCDLDAQRAYWTSVLTHAEAGSPGWKSLLSTDAAAVRGGSSAHQATDQALSVWSQTIASLQQHDSEGGVDTRAFEMLVSSLTLATVSSIAAGSLNAQLVAIVESLLAHPSTVSDEKVQIAAVECLQALTHAFPSHFAQSSATLRRFILSPSPVFEQVGELGPSPAMLAAASAYASLIELAGGGNLRISAVQSLLNHFTIGDRDNVARPKKDSDAVSTRGTIPESHRSAVSANIAHAVSRIALELNDEETTRLVTAMLLQRLSGSDPTVDGAVLYELTDLARVVDHTTVEDIAKSIFDLSKALGQDDPMTSVVLTAHTRLAFTAAGRSSIHEFFLTETLALFLHKGIVEGPRKMSRSARTDSLLELIPIVDTFLSKAKFDSRADFNPSLVSLFRSMWYLCLLSGFLSTPSRIADWQRAALVRIASHTPGLLRGTGNDFVETELEFSTILKSPSQVLSHDAVRAELAARLPQQATNARGMPSQQVVFLATVLGVESLRAEAGQPSTILTYFHNEGVNQHTQLYDTLVSVADKVNSTFVHRLTELVTSHSMELTVYSEVREVLLETCHQYSKVRSVATKYVDDLFHNFPSLLCAEEVITTLLELLTVVRRACQAEYVDEYTPTFAFHSSRGNFSIVLPDDYSIRNKILSDLHRHARSWLKAGLTRAPLEMRGLLQNYIDGPAGDFHSPSFGDDEMGKSVAIDLVRMSSSTISGATTPAWGDWRADDSAGFARTFAAKSYYGGEASRSSDSDLDALLDDLDELAEKLEKHQLKFELDNLRQVMYRCAGHLVKAASPEVEVLHQVVALPMRIFTEGAIILAQDVWTWIADARPELESRLMIEVAEAWSATVTSKQGLLSSAHNRNDPLNQETQFSPTDKEAMTKEYHSASRMLQPHTTMLSFLSSRFQSFRYRDGDLVHACLRLVLRSSLVAESWSTHQLARELRMRLLSFGFCVLQGSQLESGVECNLRTRLYEAALSWFAIPAGWSYGGNLIQLRADLQAIEELLAAVKTDVPAYKTLVSSSANGTLPGRISSRAAAALQSNRAQLLSALLDNEADRLKLWINPLMDPKRGPVASRPSVSEAAWKQLVRIAWSHWPDVAVQLPQRLKHPSVTAEVTRLVRSHPLRVQHNADALQYFIGETIASDTRAHLRHLLYWAPVPVISALRFLFPKFKGDPILLQYALRVLEHHPVEVTFFYIPQVVQALRTDDLGYAERFIFETSQISQLFCHQIIWNMKANAYRGDAGEEEDPMKPTLDRMVKMIVGSLSGEAKDFFQREFDFFDEVTSISAKLKPLIKSSKPEKKAKIDEEMAKITVDPGVYLPSNPDGVVVDIDRKSGRPLQSHAKAPFMATFKVRREHKTTGNGEAGEVDMQAQDAIIEEDGVVGSSQQKKTFDTWQAAIFKVGDDCRQDVLALQIIAMHKNIFTSLGLDLLVTPYRVTATAPGCGVIDVIPNATSRDEMGRAKINDLLSFFVIKYGSLDSVAFQRARTHFIQSMAAYSLLCYIVQIKDRHNGNIMIDGRGCITHIDFGFLFDIDESLSLLRLLLPSGVKFEPSSFKLTHEMVTLMGGRDSIGFRHFTSLCIKSFLACRPYGLAIVETASQMAGAGFPSYKDEHTMDRLRERFRLELSEVDAASYMQGVIKNALENPRSIVYDEFQRVTNGIPYVR